MCFKKFALMMGLALLGFAAGAQTVDSNYVDGVVYVKVRDTSSMVLAPYNNSDPLLNALLLTYGVDTMTCPFHDLDTILDRTFCIYFSNHSQVDQFITALETISYIEYAEKAPIFRTSLSPFTPNDIQAQQYYLDKIFARDAWGVSQGSPNIIVAIVDNGVRTTHEDLNPVLWVNPNPNSGLFDEYPNDLNGWDIADGDNNPNPPSSTTDASPFNHGTLCAGLAGAQTNNGKGIASIGFNVRIMSVKCTPDGSDGNTLNSAYDGVYYAIQSGAKVINMSWGGTEGGVTGQNLMNSALNKGIVLVAAAGNDNTSTPYYPAAYNGVIAVAATDANDIKAGFSNYGSWVDVSAPGTSLYTTKAGSNTSYGTASGTSVSTPLVAGLAALLLSSEPGLSPAQVETRLKQTSDNINSLNPNFVGQLGAGRINAAKALGTTPTVIDGIGNTVAMETGLQLYPNPGVDQVVVKFENNETITGIVLQNVAGQVVYTHSVTPSTGEQLVPVNVSLPPGFYIWHIQTVAGTVSRSWIKY